MPEKSGNPERKNRENRNTPLATPSEISEKLEKPTKPEKTWEQHALYLPYHRKFQRTREVGEIREILKCACNVILFRWTTDAEIGGKCAEGFSSWTVGSKFLPKQWWVFFKKCVISSAFSKHPFFQLGFLRAILKASPFSGRRPAEGQMKHLAPASGLRKHPFQNKISFWCLFRDKGKHTLFFL